MLPKTPPAPSSPSTVYVRIPAWMNVPDPDGADAGEGADDGRLKMRRNPTMNIKTAPISIRTIDTNGAPNTPSPNSARAMAAPPTTVNIRVGWYRSASIANVPARKRMLSKLGSLMIERNVEVIRGV